MNKIFINKTFVRSIIVFFYFLSIGNPGIISAQPKHEIRAVWIATVSNIDWPTKKNLSVKEQKQEFTDLLDMHKKNGINAIVVQVRPSADAFYGSNYEPWSEFLNGKQGQKPEPYYDPLLFMIREARKRNMEFHAWFNPFRAVIDTSRNSISDSHISKMIPEWFVSYGKGLYFDPGFPSAREYIIKVILDVVKRYDIDAVHLDDYFYPYKKSNLKFNDTLSFRLYNEGYKDTTGTDSTKADWRRNNVNKFVKTLHDSILSVKSFVKYGISPFGIWRNKGSDVNGSGTRGYTCYEGLYADVRKWLKEGWIDYVAPQLYWEAGFKAADYNILVNWWNENSFGKHVYIGHAAYRLANSKENSKAWQNASEILKQIDTTRQKSNIYGSFFFSSRSFKNNPKGLNDSLQNIVYKNIALIPPMPWKDKLNPVAPVGLESFKRGSNYLLKWKSNYSSSVFPSDTARYYVVYRTEGKETPDISDSKNIYALSNYPHYRVESKWGIFRKKYTYIITAVDRLHNESNPSNPITLKIKE